MGEENLGKKAWEEVTELMRDFHTRLHDIETKYGIKVLLKPNHKARHTGLRIEGIMLAIDEVK